ncbi:MAG: hypothetical protein J6S29_06090, partial [Methanosphaera sp.]|nr:hypothetical protein [Methanosphaera sp.]
MKKNTEKILLIISLIIILIGISTVSASESIQDNDCVATMDTPSDAQPVLQESINNQADTPEVTDTDTNIINEEKNIKKATYTVDD